jgi:hypothetical protein
VPIKVEETIIWQNPSVFPGGEFSGTSLFQTGGFTRAACVRTVFPPITFTVSRPTIILIVPQTAPTKACAKFCLQSGRDLWLKRHG